MKSILFLFAVGFISYTLQADHLPNGSQELTLDKVVIAAQMNDPWLVGSKHSQDAIEAMSIASGTLPDPKVSVTMANLAADTFDFGQEAMTNFKVGVSQMLPRGDTLAIKQRQLQILGQQFPFQREDRKARVAGTASKLWLDAYKAQESIALIEKDRALFEQLADVAQASYSSAIGKTRQQDIVRAQLELTRLDDRLTVLTQKLEMSREKLNRWISSYLSGNNSGLKYTEFSQLSNYIFARKLPDIALINKDVTTSEKPASPQTLFKYFSKHPSVQAIEQKIEASKSGIALAKQKYKPEWGVSASYGYRDANPAGVNRSDLFSVGVSFDVPLFTTNRQAAIKTEKWLLVRNLISSFESSKAQFIRLNERKKLYQDKLLPQMHDQAEASLTAYTNDDGDFAEVVRSRIAELNAAIDFLGINVERQKSIIQLNYFFTNSANQIIN